MADYLSGKSQMFIKDRSEYWNIKRRKKNDDGEYIYGDLADKVWGSLSNEQKKMIAQGIGF